MRSILFHLLTFFLLVAVLPEKINTVMSGGQDTPPKEPESGSVVCPPGVYPTVPDDCLPLGPSTYLTQLAANGITLPIQPLPAYPPDPELNALPYAYFRVTNNGAPLYGSLEDAMAGQNPVQTLDPGEIYISYTDREENDQGVFYRLRNGLWVSGDGSRISVPSFQGQLFSSTPHNAFGWILGTTPSYTAPSLTSPKTGNIYYRYHVVQIFSAQDSKGGGWKLIGPDEWIQESSVAEVDPRSTPPPGVTGDRWIEVNLQEQTLAVYDKGRMVFATLVASGVDSFWTRPGLFKIYIKKPTETMSDAATASQTDYYYIQDVPWTMYFDEERALHGAYWHNGFGYPRSHGCVNMSVGDSHWLYNWANVGDYVYVYDPSGKTPTDPSLYGSGAP